MEPIRAFNGLNNVADPLRLGLEWFKTADNIDITQTAAIRRRDGSTLAVSLSSPYAYNTLDFSRLYVVAAGLLRQVHDDLGLTTLQSGLSDAPMAWTEINNQVFFTNGIDSGIILKSGEVLPWAWSTPSMPSLIAVTGSLPAGAYQVAITYILPDGRETGASDAVAIYLDGTQSLQINQITQVSGLRTQIYIAPADSTVFQWAFETSYASSSWNGESDELGVDLTTQFLNPLPDGCSYLQVWRGRIYAAQYIQESDSTAIWVSEPLGFHLFGLNDTFMQIPGRISMLATSADALVVGTDARVYVYDGESLGEVANYGVVPGYSAVSDDDDKTILFWSKRGLCRAIPFENLTQQQISVAPGVQAGAAIIRKNGEKHYVVALHRGGAAFNQRSTS